MKIAWFTEGGWQGKVSRNNPNMRNDMAWMHTLDAVHYPITHLPIVEEKYDVGIITIPNSYLFFGVSPIGHQSASNIIDHPNSVLAFSKSLGTLPLILLSLKNTILSI